MRTISANTDFDTKLGHRARPDDLPAGRVWLPFCGFGEVVDALPWVDLGDVRACDIDRDAVAAWSRDRPEARCTVEKAEAFKFAPADRYAFADLDAFGAPYRALEHFLREARRTDPCLVVLTDGSEQKRKRAKRPYNFETHRFEYVASVEAREQSEHLDVAVRDWLGRLGVPVLSCEWVRTNQVDYLRLLIGGGEPETPEPVGARRGIRYLGDNVAAPAAALRGLEDGVALHGLTSAKWGLTDLILAVAERVGPSDAVCATWGIGLTEARQIGRAIEAGAFASFRLLLDWSYDRRHPHKAKPVQEIFGQEQMRLWESHAKFVLFLGGAFDVLIESSMNLNENPRVENFTIHGGGELPARYAVMVERVWKAMNPGQRYKAEARRLITGPLPSEAKPVQTRDPDDWLADGWDL